MAVRLLLAFIIGSLLFPSSAGAALPDSVKDTLSDSRKSVDSQHTLIVDLSSGTAVDAGDTLTISFQSGFTVPLLLTPLDVTFNDGTERVVLSVCLPGTNNIGLSVLGQTITFTACSGFTSSSNGAVITINLGTGLLKITNPPSAGIKGITIGGSYGDDPRIFNIAIVEAVTVSVTIPAPNGDVRFTGDVFPGSIVTILDGGAVVGTTVANSTSFFDKTIQSLSPGLHTFGIYGQALDGRRTFTLSFNVNVISGSTITVSGILLPPIVTVPVREKRPVFFPQSGLARHNSSVTTFISGPTVASGQGATDSSGSWGFSANQTLHLGNHTITGLVNDGSGNQSVVTNPINFEVLLSADLNVDNLISLTDFSMLMFNYGTSSPVNKAADINDNGPVDLVDFSVMMFYWTGG